MTKVIGAFRDYANAPKNRVWFEVITVVAMKVAGSNLYLPPGLIKSHLSLSGLWFLVVFNSTQI